MAGGAAARAGRIFGTGRACRLVTHCNIVVMGRALTTTERTKPRILHAATDLTEAARAAANSSRVARPTFATPAQCAGGILFRWIHERTV